MLETVQLGDGRAAVLWKLDAKAHGEKELSGYQAMAAERTRYVRKKNWASPLENSGQVGRHPVFPKWICQDSKTSGFYFIFHINYRRTRWRIIASPHDAVIEDARVLSVLHSSIARHHVPTRSCHSLFIKHRFKRMKRKDMPDKIVPCRDLLDFQLDLSIQGWIWTYIIHGQWPGLAPSRLQSQE